MDNGDGLDDALAHARSGDEGGFLMLWEELHPRLLRYLRVLGCADADDVASETWLQALRDLDRFTGTAADFRAWLFTIGRHRAIDSARSRSRFRDKILGSAMLTEPFEMSPVEDEVLYVLSTRQAVALVRHLSKDQAEVVALRVIAGLDTDVVAEMLGKSPGAIRATLHRGLKALARNPRVRALEKVDQ